MASARRTLLLLVAALAVSATAEVAAELVVHSRTADAAGWMRPGPSSCGGTVEECLGEYDGGFGLRRRLNDEEEDQEGGGGGGNPTQTQYISYAALMRNSVPCSVAGASYYNCQPGADANPYSRGCSVITQCRG